MRATRHAHVERALAPFLNAPGLDHSPRVIGKSVEKGVPSRPLARAACANGGPGGEVRNISPGSSGPWGWAKPPSQVRRKTPAMIMGGGGGVANGPLPRGDARGRAQRSLARAESLPRKAPSESGVRGGAPTNDSWNAGAAGAGMPAN